MVQRICYIVLFLFCLIFNFAESRHVEIVSDNEKHIDFNDKINNKNVLSDVSSSNISEAETTNTSTISDLSLSEDNEDNISYNDNSKNNGTMFMLKDIVIDGIRSRKQKQKILDTINIEDDELIDINNFIYFNKLKNKILRNCYFVESVNILYSIPEKGLLTLYFIIKPALHISSIDFKNIKNDEIQNEFKGNNVNTYFTERYIEKIKHKIEQTLNPTSEYIIISKSEQEDNSIKLFIEKKNMDFKKTYIRDVKFVGNANFKTETLHDLVNIKGRRENIVSAVFKILHMIIKDPQRYMQNLSSQFLGLKDYFLQSVSKTYNKTILEQDIETIKALYYKTGFLNVKINACLFSINGDESYVDLVYMIEEGDIYTVAEYNIVGEEDINIKLLKRSFMPSLPRVGDSYQEKKINSVLSQLCNTAQNIGSINITTDLRILSIQDERVHFLVTIKENVNQKIGNIKIIGNKFTNNKHILKTIPSGIINQNFNINVIQLIQYTLQQCGILNPESVIVTPFYNRVTNTQDIHCVIEEKPVIKPTSAQISGHITSEPLFNFLGLFGWYLAPDVNFGVDFSNLNLTKILPRNFYNNNILWKGEMHKLSFHILYTPDVDNNKTIHNFNFNIRFEIPEIFVIKDDNVSTNFSFNIRKKTQSDNNDSLKNANSKNTNNSKINYPFSLGWNLNYNTKKNSFGFKLLDIHNTEKGITFNHILSWSYSFRASVFISNFFPIQMNEFSCSIYIPSVIAIINKIPMLPNICYKPINIIFNYDRYSKLFQNTVVYFNAVLGLSFKNNSFILQGCENSNDGISNAYIENQDVTFFHIKCMKEKKNEDIKRMSLLKHNTALKLNLELRYLFISNQYITIYMMLFMNTGMTTPHNEFISEQLFKTLLDNISPGFGVFLQLPLIGNIYVYINPCTQIMNVIYN